MYCHLWIQILILLFPLRHRLHIHRRQIGSLDMTHFEHQQHYQHYQHHHHHHHHLGELSNVLDTTAYGMYPNVVGVVVDLIDQEVIRVGRDEVVGWLF